MADLFAQAWPRRNFREFRALGTTKTERIDRPSVTRVRGFSGSGTPRSGRAWEVSLFSDEITAAVDSDKGQIRSFRDGVWSAALGLDRAPLFSECISQETAIQRAAAYLRLTGVNRDDLLVRSAELVDPGHPATAQSRSWV